MTNYQKLRRTNGFVYLFYQRLYTKLGLIISDYFPCSNRDKKKIQWEVYQILLQKYSPYQTLLKQDFWLLLSQNVVFLGILIVSLLLLIIIGFSNLSQIVSLSGGGLVLSYLIFFFKIEVENYTFSRWLDLLIEAKKVN
jgi:hypothetical protein